MKYCCALLLLLCSLLPAHATPSPLDVDDAFRPRLIRITPQTLEVRFEIAPGHYLYRDRIHIPTKGVLPELPPGKIKQDPAFGEVATYTGEVGIRLNMEQAWPDSQPVIIKYQGCSEAGLCYPPQTASLLPEQSGNSSRSAALQQLFSPVVTERLGDAPISFHQPALFTGSFASTLGLFFLAGLGLAFTACMYPLIPIVSGIVLGNTPHRRGRAFGLVLVYVQGLALSYAGAGLLSAASGAWLAASLQQPWMIAGFSLFFVIMALAMFGLFDLQLPVRIQSQFNTWANRVPGGRYLPVFLIGILSALIVGPCVAPPLAAALVYLSRTGDLLLGGTALYAMALGMGMPLLAIGLFGRSALPRVSPRIFRAIKLFFGVILLGMALWVARPLWETRNTATGHAFQPTASIDVLDQNLARLQGKPALLDFYADWCASCIEFERNTLSDPAVQAKLKDFVLLRADVTHNRPAQQTLMAKFEIFGPPTILFFDKHGALQTERVTGKPGPAEFIEILNRIK